MINLVLLIKKIEIFSSFQLKFANASHKYNSLHNDQIYLLIDLSTQTKFFNYQAVETNKTAAVKLLFNATAKIVHNISSRVHLQYISTYTLLSTNKFSA